MSKRSKRSNGSRTGGTGDVKPQILTMNTGVGTLNKYQVAQVALPVPRFGSQQGRTTVIEVLSLDWYLGLSDISDPANQTWCYLSTGTDRISGAASALADASVDVADPLSFGFLYQHTAIAQGSYPISYPFHMDFTDNNGNGMVVATDKIFIIMGQQSGTVATNAVCKLKYRLVNIGMREYIGIVQSQQA